MGVLRRLLEVIVDLTSNLDREVERGYDLRVWGERMKYLHALQVQAQALVDITLRASSLLGHPPATPVDAATSLVVNGVLSEEDFKLFKRILGFKNIVVHEYVSVDLKLVDSILRGRRYRDVLLLAEKIFKYVSARGLDP